MVKFEPMKNLIFRVRLITSLIACCAFLFVSSHLAKAAEPITWDTHFPAMPDSYGFAGTFAGIVKNGGNRLLIVSGGANFPYENPFDETLNVEGKQPKVWHDGVFAIPISNSSLKAVGDWKKLTSKLPKPLGYGASVSLPQHGTTLFISGSAEQDGKEQFSSSVYEVSAANGEISFK